MKLYSARYTSSKPELAVFDFWHNPQGPAVRAVVRKLSSRGPTNIFNAQAFLLDRANVAIDAETMSPVASNVTTHASAESAESYWAMLAALPALPAGAPDSFDAAEVRVGEGEPSWDWMENTPRGYFDSTSGKMYRWVEGAFLQIARSKALEMLG